MYATNSLAFGGPTFDAFDFPHILDIGTCQVAHEKIQTTVEVGEPLPAEWAISRTGEPTTDAKAFISKKRVELMLLGGRSTGHKRYGLAVMVELFVAIIGAASLVGQQRLERL